MLFRGIRLKNFNYLIVSLRNPRINYVESHHLQTSLVRFWIKLVKRDHTANICYVRKQYIIYFHIEDVCNISINNNYFARNISTWCAETERMCFVFAVCLLSVVLLLPYFARGHASVLVSSVGIAYSCLVLPMVISANYKYSVNGLRPMIVNIKGKIHFSSELPSTAVVNVKYTYHTWHNR